MTYSDLPSRLHENEHIRRIFLLINCLSVSCGLVPPDLCRLPSTDCSGHFNSCSIPHFVGAYCIGIMANYRL